MYPCRIPSSGLTCRLPSSRRGRMPTSCRLRVDELSALPPLVFAGECDVLGTRLAEAAQGRAFVLMGGDCAETFEANNADSIRARLKTVLQMSVVLTYAASLPVIKVGRMAGQYFKPRSKLTETRGGVELTSYFGDAVNALRVRGGRPTPGPAAAGAGLQRVQPRRSTSSGPSRRVATPTCARCTPGTRTSCATPSPASATRPWPPSSTAPCRSCTRSAPIPRSCSGSSSTPRTRRCRSTTSAR